MARKSERLSTATKPGAVHKRVASNTATPSADAKRSKTKKATPTKSQHFQADENAGGVADQQDSKEEEPSSGEDEVGSAFDDNGEASSSDAEPDDDYDSESESGPKQRQKSTSRKGAQSSAAELARPGQKTGLGPGTQVVIKKPKARPAGKTPYSDSTIHPNTLLFLKDLAANNNREWLKMNDAEFRQAEKDWHSYVEQLTERLVEIDDTVPELPVKDVVFRIYRDVRFSPDPTPYKPYFSAAWSRTGRKGPYAHYYIQISPNNETFVGK
ncbi:hypothetical protein B0A55_08920 [Friedmanniomyces simplex]|uniref:DUF2461 domain-containing protein n=1 Tax=Friedmanniomyces simplex TaxID=329884 RepID=A0A4U0X4C8_9PEZI|nr:hypothetical protein B0A55_08920 [Friedmanniomyces simplex]